MDGIVHVGKRHRFPVANQRTTTGRCKMDVRMYHGSVKQKMKAKNEVFPSS